MDRKRRRDVRFQQELAVETLNIACERLYEQQIGATKAFEEFYSHFEAVPISWLAENDLISLMDDVLTFYVPLRRNCTAHFREFIAKVLTSPYPFIEQLYPWLTTLLEDEFPVPELSHFYSRNLICYRESSLSESAIARFVTGRVLQRFRKQATVLLRSLQRCTGVPVDLLEIACREFLNWDL